MNAQGEDVVRIRTSENFTLKQVMPEFMSNLFKLPEA